MGVYLALKYPFVIDQKIRSSSMLKMTSQQGRRELGD